MKEEAPTKKLPPKMSGGSGYISNITTKTRNDELFSSLLRINNFDSISSIKDESLDIDMSACVTISADSAMMINGNSLSTTDFWRVLDESAQNSQLDLTTSSDESMTTTTLLRPETQHTDMHNVKMNKLINNANKSLRQELQPSTFSGTFLRPEPPPPGQSISSSPHKKIVKTLKNVEPQEMYKPPKKNTQQRKIKQQTLINSKVGEPKRIIKQEPLDMQQDNVGSSSLMTNYSDNNNTNNLTKVSPSKFKLFMLPTKTEDELYANNIQETAIQNKSNNNITEELNIVTDNIIDCDDEEITFKRIYKCLSCDGMVLAGPTERRTHELVGHQVVFKCNMCARDFEEESNLKKHLKTHRSVETRKDAWKKCPDCGKCLKLGSMWMHRKIHTENKKYACDVCGQKFVQKINLTHHSRVHTAEKPFECPECQKRFQERSHLYRHQKYHAQTRSYRCDKCGKMYKTERCLKVHNLVHLEQRPFACNVCDKSFISNSKLKQHSNIHTGERPFKCNYCPRDFTNFPNWLKHTRRRHKVDHKTGEQLENIPSYCSKKSTKTAQQRKTTTAGATSTTITTTTNNSTISTTTTTNNAITVASSLTTPIPSTIEVISSTISSKPNITTIDGATLNINTTLTKNNNNNNDIKPQIKRKKKIINPPLIKTLNNNTNKTNNITINNKKNANESNIPTKTQIQLPSSITITTTGTNVIPATNVITNTCAPIMKACKIKRERKQSTPKQVQKINNEELLTSAKVPKTTSVTGIATKNTINTKLFAIPTTVNNVSTTNSISLIKREIIDTNTNKTNSICNMLSNNIENGKNSIIPSGFTDLHCLSITSAEELIMEQALEMEESGLFDARSNAQVPSDIVDTDNALSANEAATALHFKVKNEYETDIDITMGIKQEEYLSNQNRVLCSSLESSPYSSPASIELCNGATVTSTCVTNNTSNTTLFYMPSMHLNHSTQTTNSATNLVSHVAETQSNNIVLPQNCNNTLQNMTQLPTEATQALINQLYLPAVNGNGMILPLQNNQALPSVDTLLFSAAAAAAAAAASRSTTSTSNSTSTRFYRAKGVTQQNLF